MTQEQHRHSSAREGTSDSELVTAALAGERASFDVLVTRYRDHVFWAAFVKVGNAQEAEDLAQDAFVMAYQSLGQLRERDRFGPWLRKMTQNLCNMRLRDSGPRMVSLVEDAVLGEDPGQSLEQRLIHAEITQALEKLSEANRLTAILFFVDGFAQREIAEFLEAPLTTIKRRVNIARKQLKKEMFEMIKENLRDERPKQDFADEVSARIDVIRWYRSLGDHLRVGQSLMRTLNKIAESDYGRIIKDETRAIMNAIQSGKMISEAMKESAPTLGSPMALGMVRAGEIGGVLDHSAQIIVSWLEMEDMRTRLDAAYWLETLSFMLRAGVGMLTAIETMRSIPASDVLANLPDKLIEEVRDGRFADAFAGRPVFSQSAVALIRAGEKAGALGVAVGLAADEIMNDIRQMMPKLELRAEAPPELLDALRMELSDPSAERRLGALKALDYMSPQDYLPSLVSALGDADARVREFAASALEKHPFAPAAAALTAAIDDSDAGVREHALLALSVIDAEKAINCVIARGWDSSPDVRRAAVRVLAGADNSEAVCRLIEALDDPEMLVSQLAIQTLARTGGCVVDPLLELVCSRLPDIPDTAWDALHRVEPAAARDLVISALSTPGLEPNVRARLMRKLAICATPDDALLLVQALSEGQPGQLLEVSRAVGRLKVREAVPQLISWLSNPEPWVWCWAADALGEIGDPSALPGVVEKLQSLLKNDGPAAASEVAAASRLADIVAQLGGEEYAGLVKDAAEACSRYQWPARLTDTDSYTR